MIEFEKTRSVKKDRQIVVELVLGLQVGDAIIIKTRPIGSSREGPLDALGKDLVASKDIQDLRDNYWDVAVEDMRDRFLLVLWDALFLTACEKWTQDGFSNTTAAEALELGYYFNKGQRFSKKPLFDRILFLY